MNTRRARTLVDVLLADATNHPESLALTFLDTKLDERAKVTRSEFAERAGRAARLLSDLEAGSRVLVLFAPGVEFSVALFACWLAGCVPVPLPVPLAGRALPRLTRVAAVARDAGASAIVGRHVTAELIQRHRSQPELQSLLGLPFFDLDTAERGGLGLASRAPASDQLALLQYTSGSTSTPKGVMVTHANLLANAAAVAHVVQLSPGDVIVSWLPHFHDMGLIGNVLHAVYTQAHLVCLSPQTLIHSPRLWLEACSRYGARLSGGPSSAYELCIDRFEVADYERLDLREWRYAFCGAEQVRADVLRRFAARYAPCGFRGDAFLACYGLAEGTLYASGRLGEVATRRLSTRALGLGSARAAAPGEIASEWTSCGVPAPDSVLRIVDPETRRPLSPGSVGEIWLSGPCVAAGYFGRPELSEDTFRARLSETEDGGASASALARAPYLRTGDLGVVIDGELYVTGRIKDIVILDGKNHYPDDIEATVVAAHPDLRFAGVAAFAMDVDGKEQLTVVAETHRQVDADALERYALAIARAVGEHHEVEAARIELVLEREIPRTTSGKVQRARCRELLSLGELRGRERPRHERVRPASAAARPPGLGVRPELKQKVIERVAARCQIELEAVDLEAPLSSLGLSSMHAVELARELSELLNREISPTLFYECSNLNGVLARLGGASPEPDARPAGHPAPLEPIAVIGLACRLPGAADAEQFWKNLRAGVDGIGSIGPNRWPDALELEPAPGQPDPRRGGFLDAVSGFDADYFGISAEEARSMDPQQRLLLELSVHTLEDAGVDAARIAGADVGVFVGISTNDYARLHPSGAMGTDVFFSTGKAFSIAANRLSYFFDLRGPSVAVDTACSSSLVAVHLACASLRAGECSMALVGGVNLILSSDLNTHFAYVGALSTAGQCRPFDAAADGVLRGEGAAVLALKPLSAAERDGDHVYALLLGSAVNQDGKSNGMTAPSAAAQTAVIRSALERAAIRPREVAYVEAHGTGTRLGDPIELRALGSVFAEGEREHALLIGSTKSNFGHLEAAAGVVSLVKTILALERRELPPSLHFTQPNPHVSFEELKLAVVEQLRPWPNGGRRVAGVSSFGFGGTNAHVVVAEGQPRSLTRPEHALPLIFTLSARTKSALVSSAASLSRFVVQGGGDLFELCHSSAMRRTHHRWRSALVVHSLEDLRGGLASLAAGRPGAHVFSGERRRPPGVTFVFSGQGGNYAGMAQELFRSQPAARRAIEELDSVFRRVGGFSIVPAVLGDPEVRDASEAPRADAAPAREVFWAQVLQFSLHFAVTESLASFGVRPSSVVGHSLGEVSAAWAAGVLDLETTVKLLIARAESMQSFSDVAGFTGAMAMVRASAEQLAEVLAGEPLVNVAVHNSPKASVLSGEAQALSRVLERISALGLTVRRVELKGSGHSPLIEPVRAELRQRLTFIEPKAESSTVYSTTLGRRASGSEFDAEHWASNVVEPVLFASAIQAAALDGAELFVEIGPQPMLTPFVIQNARQVKRRVTAVAALRKGAERLALLETIAVLYSEGVGIDFRALYPNVTDPWVSLPRYPFEHKHYWSAGISETSKPASRGRLELGRPFRPSSEPAVFYFELELGLDELPELGGHAVFGSAVLPAAGYLVLAQLAGKQALGASEVTLADVHFSKILVLESRPRRIQLRVEREAERSASFRVFDATDPEQPVLHAEGRLRAESRALSMPPPLETEPAALHRVAGIAHYTHVRSLGAEYAAPFTGVQEIFCGDGCAVGRIALEPSRSLSRALREVALLDACFQVLLAVRAQAGGAVPRLAIAAQLGRLELDAEAMSNAAELRVYAEREASTRGSLSIETSTGELVGRAEGLSLREIDETDVVLRQAYYAPRWSEAARHEDGAVNARGLWLVLDDGLGVGERVAEQLESRGAECWLVRPGARQALGGPQSALPPHDAEAYERLIGEAQARGLSGIVQLWPLRSEPQGFSSNAVLGASSSLLLAQALARRGVSGGLRFVIVTSGSQSLDASEPVAPNQGASWGFGRVLVEEHPEWRPLLIDLPDSEPWQQADRLVSWALDAEGNETQVALRPGRTLVARLERCSLEARPALGRLDPDGCYVVSGGLGGLGLVTARVLAEAGAGNLCLFSRRAPDPSTEATLAELRQRGARVSTFRADVCDVTELRSMLSRARELGPIRGIVHCAADLADSAILNMQPDQLERVLKPKLQGAWNLHLETERDPLHLFVLFSSAAALLASPGQANYVAANTFLDQFAHYRRQKGLPALSIDWGPWASVGGAERGGYSEALRAFGIDSLSVEQGARALSRLIGSDLPQVGVIRLDFQQLGRMYPRFASAPYFERFHASLAAQRVDDGALRAERLATQPPAQAKSSILGELITRLAELLGVEAAELPPQGRLHDLGVDSISALQVRNGLEQRIGVSLPLARFVQGSTLEELAAAVYEQVTISRAASAISAAPPLAPDRMQQNSMSSVEAEALLARIGELSSEQVDQFVRALSVEETAG